MENHEEFDKELETAPKNADAFLIVLPYNRKKGWYDASQVKYEHTEGMIDKEDIAAFLGRLRDEVPRSLHKINYEMLDGAAILVLLLSIIWLGLGIYFSLGNEFTGFRAASVIISSIGCFGSLVYIAIACTFRSRLNKNRVTKLEEIIAKSQDEIFSKKGALVSLSPLESYIMIEMVWKYVRIAMYSNAEDADLEPKIPSLKEFNRETIYEILEESKDKILINAIQKNAIFNPEGLHVVEDNSAQSSFVARFGDMTERIAAIPGEEHYNAHDDVDEVPVGPTKVQKITKKPPVDLARYSAPKSQKIEIIPYTKYSTQDKEKGESSDDVYEENNIFITLPQSPDEETKQLAGHANQIKYSVIRKDSELEVD